MVGRFPLSPALQAEPRPPAGSTGGQEFLSFRMVPPSEQGASKESHGEMGIGVVTEPWRPVGRQRDEPQSLSGRAARELASKGSLADHSHTLAHQPSKSERTLNLNVQLFRQHSNFRLPSFSTS